MSDGTGKGVVVIDDSEIVLELLRFHLEALGHDVTTVSDIRGLDAIKGKQIDLIILDVHMPGAHGTEVAELLRSKWNISAPIYFFSDSNESQLRERVAASGVDGYICKGDGMPSALQRISEILELD